MFHQHEGSFHRRATPGRPPRRLSAALAVALIVVLGASLAACGSSSSSAGGSGSSSTTSAATSGAGSTTGVSTPGSFYGPPTKVDAPATTVKVIDNDFAPKNLVVPAGTKITFDATGHNQHDIVPDDPSTFDFTVKPAQLPPGGKVSFTFSKPGTYYYYCSLHATPTAGTMRGVITVTPSTVAS